MQRRTLHLMVMLTIAVSACSGREKACPGDSLDRQFGIVKDRNHECILANDKNRRGDVEECMKGWYAVAMYSCLTPASAHTFHDFYELIDELVDTQARTSVILQSHDEWLRAVRAKL